MGELSGNNSSRRRRRSPNGHGPEGTNGTGESSDQKQTEGTRVRCDMCDLLVDPVESKLRTWDVRYRVYEGPHKIANPVVAAFRDRKGWKAIDRLCVCEDCNDSFYRIWLADAELTYLGEFA